jgi:hypothetical protein
MGNDEVLAATIRELNIRDQRIRELERRLAATEWKEITPENLPKVGDEVWGPYTAYSGAARCYLQAITLLHQTSMEAMKIGGFTHFRPIAAPPEPRGKA